MYSSEIAPSLLKRLEKIIKKDRPLYERVMKKMEEVLSSEIDPYKNLRYDLKDKKRVHIGHFVLVFQFIEMENKVRFLDLDHHDNIY